MTDAVALLKDVTYRRDGNLILRGLDLIVRQGEHWALLGPNGAGKSTLLNLCGAWTHPSSGVVEVLGHRLERSHYRPCAGPSAT
ncbi:ABC-type molybdenum transport system ATPase subunit/photorepair protein PhrA [Tsukamurella ocularis]|nr:ABC-type molybdenum transport system ATPase subunit/photorepair protein PhrA [Tsukamurella ocularis]